MTEKLAGTAPVPVKECVDVFSVPLVRTISRSVPVCAEAEMAKPTLMASVAAMMSTTGASFVVNCCHALCVSTEKLRKALLYIGTSAPSELAEAKAPPFRKIAISSLFLISIFKRPKPR